MSDSKSAKSEKIIFSTEITVAKQLEQVIGSFEIVKHVQKWVLGCEPSAIKIPLLAALDWSIDQANQLKAGVKLFMLNNKQYSLLIEKT